MAKKKVAEALEETVVTPIVEEKKEPEIVIVKDCENLRIRETPSTKGLVNSIVASGTELMFKNKVNNEWTRIQTTDGKQGYVMSKYIGRK